MSDIFYNTAERSKVRDKTSRWILLLCFKIIDGWIFSVTSVLGLHKSFPSAVAAGKWLDWGFCFCTINSGEGLVDGAMVQAWLPMKAIASLSNVPMPIAENLWCDSSWRHHRLITTTCPKPRPKIIQDPQYQNKQ